MHATKLKDERTSTHLEIKPPSQRAPAGVSNMQWTAEMISHPAIASQTESTYRPWRIRPEFTSEKKKNCTTHI